MSVQVPTGDVRRPAKVRADYEQLRGKNCVMADKIMYNGKQLERGERVTQKGKGWRLITTKGKRRYFVATLVAETNVRGEQVLVFRVAK